LIEPGFDQAVAKAADGAGIGQFSGQGFKGR
jgi:hypothetical protein